MHPQLENAIANTVRNCFWKLSAKKNSIHSYTYLINVNVFHVWIWAIGSAAPCWLSYNTALLSTHQGMPFHVFAAGELLATDFTGVGPLACVRAHVPLQNALVHGWEAAVWTLEFLPDHCEVIYCREEKEEKHWVMV